MRFIKVAQARRVAIGDVVFTLDDAGKYGTGKLVSRTENGNGVELKFEVPQYFNPDAPSINPVIATNIVYIAVMKDRTPVVALEVIDE